MKISRRGPEHAGNRAQSPGGRSHRLLRPQNPKRDPPDPLPWYEGRRLHVCGPDGLPRPSRSPAGLCAMMCGALPDSGLPGNRARQTRVRCYQAHRIDQMPMLPGPSLRTARHGSPAPGGVSGALFVRCICRSDALIAVTMSTMTKFKATLPCFGLAGRATR